MKYNLHVCEACNYGCKHCFSVFDEPKMLILTDWQQILDKIAAYDPEAQINIAGGEPTLYPYLKELIVYAAEQGMHPSLITNGTRSLAYYISIAPYLDTFGVSVDSLDPEISRRIGRCDSKGRVLTEDELNTCFDAMRKKNPALRIKINTVVNAANKSDGSLLDAVQRWHIDRWKILRCKNFVCDTTDNTACCVTKKEFYTYAQEVLQRFNLSLPDGNVLYTTAEGHEIVVEETLSGSYIFVDPLGNLLENISGNRHRTVANLLKYDMHTAMQRLRFDEELYHARYREMS